MRAPRPPATQEPACVFGFNQPTHRSSTSIHTISAPGAHTYRTAPATPVWRRRPVPISDPFSAPFSDPFSSTVKNGQPIWMNLQVRAESHTLRRPDLISRNMLFRSICVPGRPDGTSGRTSPIARPLRTPIRPPLPRPLMNGGVLRSRVRWSAARVARHGRPDFMCPAAVPSTHFRAPAVRRTRPSRWLGRCRAAAGRRCPAPAGAP